MGKEGKWEFLSNFSGKIIDLALCPSFHLGKIKIVSVSSLESVKSLEIFRGGGAAGK